MTSPFPARLLVDPARVVSDVPRRLFGSFVEHMGRCVYTGIVEPGHESADADGIRGDVLDLTRELGPTVVRYPGGNFVSGYDWEDTVGPVEDRPRRLEAAWHEIEPNTFGLHEFVDWSRRAGVEVMQAVNLGTRGIDAARRLVEYANHPGGTQLSDLRRANGAEEPFDIRLWCLGNEMDGPWQIGHKTAEEYGRLAAETAKAMRMVDPRLELVVAGSSGMDMPTFGEWERTVLRHTYQHVDYLSLHAYYQEHDGRPQEFLTSATRLDAFIEEVVRIVDEVREEGGHAKRIDLALDEWNVWYQTRWNDPAYQAALAESEWAEHPRLIEDEYSVTDAVVVGTLLHSLLRHADRVKIANQAQLVNVIAPIRSEEGGRAWRQTTFYPFARIAALAVGQVVDVRVDAGADGGAPLVDAAATVDPETGALALFVANQSVDAQAQVTVDVPDGATLVSAEILSAPADGDRFSANTEEKPDHVALRPLDAAMVDGAVSVSLPPVSWAVVTLALPR
ncbi:arabinosylfuranosidase ArfA [Leifsonia poae]|uniref:arabinosylfuranosidase ArfA n=1 Tax=Leifsonia poae TaxID=110933 RepID=UPI001CC120DE|nr:alpha-L-arabinofuranosidase C-terminal domain-containing protein [Leifsonia poae]